MINDYVYFIKHCILLSLFKLVFSHAMAHSSHKPIFDKKLSIMLFQVSFLHSELWQICVCVFPF